jgi:hypothetical protein
MELFQKFLNRVGRTYGQADKTLFGGLLPGGAASFVSPVKQKVQATAVNTGKVLAGAAMNQLPDRANLFARYVTGVGNTNLQLDPSTLMGLRTAASPEPMVKGIVPNPFKVPEEILVLMEQRLKTGDPRNLNSPMGDEMRRRVEEGRKNRNAPDFVSVLVPGHGPGLPQTGAYVPYGNRSVGKEVTNTLGAFNAEVVPGKSIRFIDTYDMLNSSEDPELVSGRFQPMKAIEEIQSIWDPSKGSLQRSVPDVFKQKSKRKYSQAEETIKATSQSPTSSPATALGRAMLYAMPWKPTAYPVDVTIPY